MANALLPTPCASHPLHRTSRNGLVNSVPCRARSHVAFGRSRIRPASRVQAHSTEAPAKPKARPGEKKGACDFVRTRQACLQQLTGMCLMQQMQYISHTRMPAGFVEEMRFVAMKLHTKDQAPKEGGKEAAPQPFQKVNSACLQM